MILVLLRFQSDPKSEARYGSMVGMSCVDFDRFMNAIE